MDKDCVPVRGFPHAVALAPLYTVGDMAGNLLFRPGAPRGGADGVIALMEAQHSIIRLLDADRQTAYRQCRDLVALLAAERGEPSPVTAPRG